MNTTISPELRHAAVRAARARYIAEFGPIPGSTWQDIGDAVLFHSMGCWRDPENEAWMSAWDDESEEWVNNCGERDHAERLTAVMDWVRANFAP